MKLISLTIEHLQIPFNLSFSHASATRSQTDSVLIQAKTKNNIAYGESCPRSYVTNENYQSALAFFNTYKAEIINSIIDLESLKSWVKDHRNDIDNNPAAWCAIELALLDLLAKEQSSTVEELLHLPKLSGSFCYTAVLGDNKLEQFSEILKQHQTMGFTEYKIKLSGNLAHDKAKCVLLIEEIPNAKIRLDANNLWQNPNNVIEYIEALDHRFIALEEPLGVGDYKNLSSIYQQTGIKIILDESCLRLQHFDHLKDDFTPWIINVRISKMGGLLRSIELVNKAKQLAIPCIIGAQVGETSLLTRAALSLVNAHRNAVIAQEGAYGTYLLQHDIFEPIMIFDSAGKIDEKQFNNLTTIGFGLQYTQADTI
ncbi:MAG: enolase C-terminal domain-like protein [Methylophagaceae bacterium]